MFERRLFSASAWARTALSMALVSALFLPHAHAQPVLITAPQTLNPGDTTITPTAGGSAVPLTTADITVRGTTLTVSGSHTIRSLVVERAGPFFGNPSGPAVPGIVTHVSGDVNGLNLIVTNDVVVRGAIEDMLDSLIDVSGRGYATADGPGSGQSLGSDSGAGGGHGGSGGNSLYGAIGGNSYGSITQPSTLGSASGRGSGVGAVGVPGGGVVRLTIGGTFTINGVVTARGANGFEGDGARRGGGAGGSIWITADTIAGTGAIRADGGNAYSCCNTAGGGAGGRIALYFDTNTYSGIVSAIEGAGSQRGGAGTIYRKATSSSLGNIEIAGSGSGSSSSFAETSLVASEVNAPLGDLTIAANARVVCSGQFTLQRVELTSGGWATHPYGDLNGLRIDVDDSFLIDSTSAIDVSERGYSTADGPGSGQSLGSDSGAGGGHGGRGGNSLYGAQGGNSYGSMTQPTTLGSASGRGSGNGAVGVPGGGAVRLNVGGTLTIDGIVTARGANGYDAGGARRGGGAGGSIWLSADTIAGSGAIRADGGHAISCCNTAGGGAGGRIALYSNAAGFPGVVSAIEGSGSQRGGAGTIFRKTSSAAQGKLEIAGSGSGLNSSFAETIVGAGEFNGVVDDLTVGSNAKLSCFGSLTPQRVVLTNGGVLTHAPGDLNGLQMDIGDSLFIDATSSIDVSERGYSTADGPGSGQSLGSDSGAGGGHGGRGGNSLYGAQGGNSYGSMTQPTTLGSASGRGSGNGAVGVPGGGAVRLNVGGTFTLNGIVSARGANGYEGGGARRGGGAGGSVWANAAAIVGTGAIRADGGSAYSCCNTAGGGAGGRIALYTCSSTLTGANVSANGGAGSQSGGHGTVYIDPDAIFITTQSTTLRLCPLGSSLISVNVIGQGPFEFAWRKNGIAINPLENPTATTASLLISNAKIADDGSYDCIIGNVCGSAPSNPAELRVCAADFNCDGFVNDSDFVLFAASYDLLDCADAAMPPGCPSDINGDGLVDDSDFVLFVSAYNALLCP